MALSKYKLGTLIQESFRKNSEMKFDVSYVRGISNNKQIAKTAGQMLRYPKKNCFSISCVNRINIYQKIKTKQCFWFFRSFVSRYIGFTI